MEQKNLSKLLIDETVYETHLSRSFIKRKPFELKDKRKVTALIPGVIEKLYVHKGAKVKGGDRLLVLEAMKMKNDVNSLVDGIVKEIYVKQGQSVAKGELLLELE